jgi:hypothetical protein
MKIIIDRYRHKDFVNLEIAILKFKRSIDVLFKPLLNNINKLFSFLSRLI